MGLPEFVEKIDSETLKVRREEIDTWTREMLEERIAMLQLRLDRLRAIRAKFYAA